MNAAQRQTRLPTDLGPSERAVVKQAIEAVCAELGLEDGERARRRAVRERIVEAYRLGRRQPLNLVDAGLGY
jgi:hypothetical protein